MSNYTVQRSRAVTVATAPVILTIGFLYHPHLPNVVDSGFLPGIEAAVAADPTRWAIAHLVITLGSALVGVACLAIRNQLRDLGEDRWSSWAAPFAVFGSALYAAAPTMEFTPLGAFKAGGDVQAAQAAIMPWVGPVLLTGALTFGIGAVGFAVAIIRSNIAGPVTSRAIAVGLVVMAVARMTPIHITHFYVQGVAAVVALVWLAVTMTRRNTLRLTTPSSLNHPA